MLALLLSGFGTGLSLIVAIGSQNAFLLQQGLRETLPPQWASAVGPALASIAVYVLMAAVLIWRPSGLFGQRT